MPLRLEAAILSRMRSPVTSRSNCANDSSTLSVRRPIEVVVLNCCVTATNDTPAGVKQLDHLGEVRQRPRQPVNLVDHHHIDQTLADIDQQALQSGPLHRGPGQTAIVICGLHQAPALPPLALDERFARLALRVERIEILLESFFGRLARIDRAAPKRSLRAFHDGSPGWASADRKTGVPTTGYP